MNAIAHVDEIFLKGANQAWFYKILFKNLRALFPHVAVERVEGGIWLGDLKSADLDRLSHVPGIANFAPALKIGHSLEQIKRAVDDLLPPGEAKTFRVTATRSNKDHKLSSGEIDRAIGQHVVEKYGWSVSLKNFQYEINISVGRQFALVYGHPAPGAGGLPTGTAGRVLCLLSGGIDSPVAAYNLMKRGAEIGLIHFQNQTHVSAEVGEKILDLAKTLSQYQPQINLWMAPFADWQKQIVMKVPAAYRMLLTRRVMLKIAQSVAQKNKYLALATGDSLGQVASQTLENLRVVYESVSMLVLSPLMGSNKNEITNLARSIGALEISQRPYEDCCSLFVAKHPETKAKLTMVKELESRLDLRGIDPVIQKSQVIKCSYSPL